MWAPPGPPTSRVEHLGDKVCVSLASPGNSGMFSQSCTSLHSPQQHRKVPVASRPQFLFLLSVGYFFYFHGIFGTFSL